ncbi:GNAT family N-acetyltransferase [Paenibacillus turicensis]|uniref:GNAT family N-acetyltransferase n=1 Tax=Paenibacillus turicensis TaxID=160487 RepID=UPI003D28662F
MLITGIEVQDAPALLNLQLQLDKENSFMLYEYGERPKQMSIVKEMIEHFHNTGSLLLAARTRKGLAGYISAERGNANRISHTAYVVIGVLDKHQRQGVGAGLMEYLLKWAKSSKITRLELTVMTHNKAAISLYEKFGFKQEGIREKAMLVDRKYVDEYYMAKLL